MPELPIPCLMLLTDRTLLPPNWTLAQAVAPCVTGGVNLVALREADLPAGPRKTVARFVRDGIRGRCPLLLAEGALREMPDDADGVVLEEDAPVGETRAALGPERPLGVMVRTPEAAQAAEGADFALVLFDWTGRDAAQRIIARIADFRAATGLPLIAGLDAPVEHVRACVAAGASGIALCSVGMQSADRAAAMRAYREALRQRGQ
jgi:thiamine monophosphate synthase